MSTRVETWPTDNIDNLLSRKGVSRDDVVRISEVGSTIYGIAVEGYDDLDLTAIRFVPSVASPVPETTIHFSARRACFCRLSRSPGSTSMRLIWQPDSLNNTV